jgi:transposase
MVLETVQQQHGERHGVVTRVANQLGVGSESQRKWVEQVEIDGGVRPGTTTEDRNRIVELEKENRELRRANRDHASGPTRSCGRPRLSSRLELDPRPPR